ncbi:MAG TPA: PrsW family glutamic-type intramembrane protease [Propionibacteriaceae bacterium]|nr:PrsW family glutamic-type intramembrane protease [Propionibacteriaceae bacterium]
MTEPAMLPAGAPGQGMVPVAPAALLRRPRSALTWVTTIVLGLGGLMIAILIFLLGGPTGALIATLLAAVSFPVLILICFWLDRYEPEPASYRLAALGWGAVAAVVLSFIAEQLLFGLPGTTEFAGAALGAPVVEELAKGLFLVAIVIFRHSEIDGLLDGIIYGALVGIGFAFVEDIVYYLQSLQAGELGITFFLRGIMSPFAHPLFTAATGIGIGIAVSTRRPGVRVFAPILGFLAAIVMHAIWNGSAFWGANGFLFAYGAIMLPLLVVVLAVAIWASSREGKMLTAALQQISQMGFIRPEEIRWITRLSDRMSARGYAKRLGGRPAVAALRAYQQTMIEVAFLHHRGVSGTAPADINQRMRLLLQRAAWLRPYVVFPPAPRAATWPPVGPAGPWGPPRIQPGASTFPDRR